MRQIGETFKFGEITIIVKECSEETDLCQKCYFGKNNLPCGLCTPSERDDNNDVYFVSIFDNFKFGKKP